jgi:hypothetical protein
MVAASKALIDAGIRGDSLSSHFSIHGDSTWSCMRQVGRRGPAGHPDCQDEGRRCVDGGARSTFCGTVSMAGERPRHTCVPRVRGRQHQGSGRRLPDAPPPSRSFRASWGRIQPALAITRRLSPLVTSQPRPFTSHPASASNNTATNTNSTKSCPERPLIICRLLASSFCLATEGRPAGRR